MENNKFDLITSEVWEKGFVVIDDFLVREIYLNLRDEIIYHIDQENLKKAAIGNLTLKEVNDDIRGDKILWINKSTASKNTLAFFSIINELIEYLNYVCFAGVNDYEFHYAFYPTGAFYKKHLDQFKSDDSRLFSIIYYLNEGWLKNQGGELKIYSEDKNELIEPIGNRLVFFNSAKLYHEVLTTNVPRYSLTGWLKKTKYVPF